MPELIVPDVQGKDARGALDNGLLRCRKELICRLLVLIQAFTDIGHL